ncbi:MAG: FliI/YscN family ATPase [Candidatus Eisenbacteria bacterium]|uniref:FliI/YscN family ATPase n=1 Tax=Eiseniibacteriota bacterium TaxID=2212470 RepID=A0A937XF26_UNCEI|nr:FliI/YscN family ATPase [Candidatus Eisenbacteria bacterium]
MRPEDLRVAERAMARVPAVAEAGRVLRVAGGVVEATGPRVPVGELCVVETAAGLPAEVIGFRADAMLLMPLGASRGIRPGALVSGRRRPLSVRAGDGVLGRILDGRGDPIDGLGPLRGALRPITAEAPAPLERRRIHEPLATGVRAIDGLLTCGKGQRLGIFAGSGVGKSVLLGTIARHARADVNVIALVGERGREVRDFLERDLGDGLARSVVVVATAEQPPLLRIKAAMVALTLAEHFRERGRDVLFMMDSLTRAVMAQREIGLAAGEPPTTKGYPPSAFALLPQLLERVGAARRGSITGLFAVLVEADDLSEPVSDASRAILDGHIALSRRLAQRNHYPAVDVLASVSRIMPQVATPEHLSAAEEIRRLLAVHAEVEEVLNLGAYVAGSNPAVDEAIERLPAIRAFLTQRPPDGSTYEETLARLRQLAAPVQARREEAPMAPALTPAGWRRS